MTKKDILNGLRQISNGLKQIAIAVDQLINTLMGGWADETMSSRAYRLGRKSKAWAYVEGLLDAVFFWDKEMAGDVLMRHCQLSYNSELLRLQSPPETR